MSPRPWMEGVPAAGHLSDSGFWHPGSAASCDKCHPPRPRVCPGSGHRMARPAMTTAPEERCPRCERYVRVIPKYGDWQLASHAPLGAIRL